MTGIRIPPVFFHVYLHVHVGYYKKYKLKFLSRKSNLFILSASFFVFLSLGLVGNMFILGLLVVIENLWFVCILKC